MSLTPDNPKYMDREFLPVRAKILEIAAAMDRIQRANQDETADSRWEQLQAGIKILLSPETDRAEQVQLLFSREYDKQWRETLSIKK